jgi:metal-responsive CopG/Arc/MetJ family transcriptional regulator
VPNRQPRGQRRVPIHIDPSLVERLDAVARLEGVSRSGLIVRLVREGVSKAEKKATAA